MDISKIKLLLNTVKYLKPIQVYYRFYYFFRNRLFSIDVDGGFLPPFTLINWESKLKSSLSYTHKGKSFSFLNVTHQFSEQIDWNYNKYGKLWTYNLNYFDFLNQKEMTNEIGIGLILDFIKNDGNLKDGKESYPISLRGMNWVKFLSSNEIKDKKINQTLFNHYQILFNNLEYHLLGNHLLENAFSLLFGAYYFQDQVLYEKSKKVLISELNEQILIDGGHFELSPMYHQIILFRVLDCVQLIKLNSWKDNDLLKLLENTASKMLSWLNEVTFDNGDIPMVNDSSFGIAPTTKELLNYGKYLGLEINKVKLSDSGYRMFRNKNYELFLDIGHVGASYQPAHVHSDTFNFILYANNQPVFVDTGVSTYEKNELRQTERSTTSHNTVQIGDFEQTHVWGGFRVAKRAKIISLKETKNTLASTHDGYKNLGLSHTRNFLAGKDSIIIKDNITKQSTYKQIANFHLHPSITNVTIDNTNVLIDNIKIEISFKGKNIFIEKEDYEFAAGFNKTIKAIKLKVLFERNLETIISI